MQLREGSFHGPRPTCPEHPKHLVHRHGFYVRFENGDSQRRLRIERFVCPRCGRTLSVLPKNRLPYIALNTTIVESPAPFGSAPSICSSRLSLDATPESSSFSIVAMNH